MILSSFLDIDGQCRAGGSGLAGVLGLFYWRVVGQKGYDTVVVTLIEYFAGVEHALTR
jgi:hypothetical protein